MPPTAPSVKLGVVATVNDGEVGSVVISVMAGGLAELIGIQAGDRILLINDRPIETELDVAVFLSEVSNSFTVQYVEAATNSVAKVAIVRFYSTETASYHYAVERLGP